MPAIHPRRTRLLRRPARHGFAAGVALALGVALVAAGAAARPAGAGEAAAPAGGAAAPESSGTAGGPDGRPAAGSEAERAADAKAEPETAPGAEPAAEPAPEVLRIRLDSLIHPVAAQFVKDAVEEADATRAAALVVELSTPGGLSVSTREISTSILGARTPVVAYVAPSGAQAASAGFFILMAADVAAMAPGTNTGAAHPVGGSGEDIEGDAGKKAEEDAAATIRSLATRHRRNVELAEKAVVESKSFSAEEALEGKLIDLIAPSLQRLLVDVDGRAIEKHGATFVLSTAAAPVRTLEMSAFRRALAALAHPNIAVILLSLGFLGLYFELMNPGAVLPGVVGAICLILAFFALSVLPFNYAGLALIMLAIILFIAEIKVTSFGLLTVGGVISLILGAMLLFKTPEPALRVSLELVVALGAFAAVVVGALMILVVRAQRSKVHTGSDGLVREKGRAYSALSPRGKVFVHGEIWHAIAERPVAAGEPVEVVGVDGMWLKVRPLTEAAPVATQSSS
jgi:membrane-bound serine protease (ClpP class)